MMRESLLRHDELLFVQRFTVLCSTVLSYVRVCNALTGPPPPCSMPLCLLPSSKLCTHTPSLPLVHSSLGALFIKSLSVSMNRIAVPVFISFFSKEPESILSLCLSLFRLCLDTSAGKSSLQLIVYKHKYFSPFISKHIKTHQ